MTVYFPEKDLIICFIFALSDEFGFFKVADYNLPQKCVAVKIGHFRGQL